MDHTVYKSSFRIEAEKAQAIRRARALHKLEIVAGSLVLLAGFLCAAHLDSVLLAAGLIH